MAEVDTLAIPLTRVEGLKDLLIRESQKKPNPIINTKCAAALLHAFGEREAAMTILNPIFSETYLKESKRMPLWGPLVELVLEADSNAKVLNEFDTKLAAAKTPAAEFAVWLLRLRQGKEAGKFPVEAYRKILDDPDSDWLSYGISRADGKALRFKSDFFDWKIMLGRESMGFDSLSLQDEKSIRRMLMLLGGLDRLNRSDRTQ